MGACMGSQRPVTPVSYESLVSSLKSGDVVLFSSNHFISWIIRMGTDDIYSHVGMVIKTTRFSGQKGADPDDTYIWHSDMVSSYDMLTKTRNKNGPALVSLRSAIRTSQISGGNIYIRQLRGFDKSIDIFEENDAFFYKNSKKEYERDPLELLNSQYDGPFGENDSDLTYLFCSEILALTYDVVFHIANKKKMKSYNEYTPADFSVNGSHGLFQEHSEFPLKKGYRFSNTEIFVKRISKGKGTQ